MKLTLKDAMLSLAALFFLIAALNSYTQSELLERMAFALVALGLVR